MEFNERLGNYREELNIDTKRKMANELGVSEHLYAMVMPVSIIIFSTSFLLSILFDSCDKNPSCRLFYCPGKGRYRQW
jgi:hypothetical protein